MGEKFKGNSPEYARIKIDYGKKKPKVSFSYPEKKNTQRAAVYFMVLLFWLPFVLGILGTITIIEFFEEVPPPEESGYDIYNYSSYLEFFEKENITRLTYEGLLERETKSNWIKVWEALFNKETFKSLFPLLIIFIPPIIIHILFEKPLTNLFPVFNGFIGTKRRRVFKPNDVWHNDKYGYYCELPLFKNVVLNYEAKKDFSKYLKFFEIKEHKFQVRKVEKRKKGKKRNRNIDNSMWYARFYFSQKPLTGEVEIIYK